MNGLTPAIWRIRTLCFVLIALNLPTSRAASLTSLDRYVRQPDPAFRFRLLHTLPGDNHTTFVLEMVSQTWRTRSEVDRTEWKHWITVVRPTDVRTETALLFIAGGNNNRPAPKKADDRLAKIAVATHSVVAELSMVPNQPLRFAGELIERSEDEMIAYTWDKFLRGGDDFWPARLPMTKSAVRAMDSLTGFFASAEGGSISVKSFVIAGGSKRGWTTWATAAVDPRVKAIAPIVIDLLNLEPSFRHHWEVYGFYAPAVGDYEAMRIMDWEGTPEYRKLLLIEDPYEYRARFTMPKFLIHATGDQFFLPDSSRFYWDDLPGQKHVRYVPNADHSLKETDAIQSLLAWYHSILTSRPLPTLRWKLHDDGSLTVSTESKPSGVLLWHASNPNARDFRKDTIGNTWRSEPLQPNAKGDFHAPVTKPDRGWKAYLIEMTFPSPGEIPPLKITTPVYIIPDVVPYDFKTKKPLLHPAPPRKDTGR